jgi:hypothetical protein
MSTKSHTHKKCGTLRKKTFPTMSMLKFTNKGRFFLQYKRHLQNFCIENPDGEHMHWMAI